MAVRSGQARQHLTLDEALQLPRVAVVGGPGTGKTTLSERRDPSEVVHTDDYREIRWDDVPEAVIAACGARERFLVEGVQAARALRKGLEVDAVIYCETERKLLTNRQRGTAKAVQTIMRDWWKTRKDAGLQAVPVVGF